MNLRSHSRHRRCSSLAFSDNSCFRLLVIGNCFILGLATATGTRQRMTRHHLSGGAQGPDPVQALLQAGPPDAVQPPPAAGGTRWCLVAADAGRAVLRRIAAKRANVVLLNISHS